MSSLLNHVRVVQCILLRYTLTPKGPQKSYRQRWFPPKDMPRCATGAYKAPYKSEISAAHRSGSLEIDIYLDDLTRALQDCDYPGVLSYDKSKVLFDRELAPEERSVRGNLVVGLSQADIALLDVFEADVRGLHVAILQTNHVSYTQEYDRRKVQVHPLGPLEPLNDPSDSVIASSASPLPSVDQLTEPVVADTYIWVASTSLLAPELWSYDAFIRDNAWKWVGPSENGESYTEVDRRRAMNGIINHAAEFAKEGAAN